VLPRFRCFVGDILTPTFFSFLELATDWHTFIVTTSLWAAEGLLSDELLDVWRHYRAGYLAYVEGPLTAEKRATARAEFALYGQGLERELGITACTISTHLVVAEADLQIPVTGPITESMGSWVERLMFTLLEHTRRRSSLGFAVENFSMLTHFCLRRITNAPEKAMVTGYLLDQFVLANSAFVPVLPQAVAIGGLYDDQNQEPHVSCLPRLSPRWATFLIIFSLSASLWAWASGTRCQ